MADHGGKRHIHGGLSSSGFFDAENVLKSIRLREGAVFLDVGCGDGHFSLAASKIVGEKGRVYAIDADRESLGILQHQKDVNNIGNIEVLLADITKKLPLANESIYFCFMANVFHGFVVNREVGDAVKEIVRVLKPEGTLAIIDFKKLDGTPGPPVSERVSEEEVERLVTPYGFDKYRLLDVGTFHYAILFKRSQ